MKITPDSQDLLSLIAKAQQKKFILPEFQRSFVWSYAAVKDLLVSIFKGYYIGSILLLEADSKSLPFAFRPIEGVEGKPDDDSVEKYILDGQQRITTLHYVMFGPEHINLKYASNPYRFFLDLKAFTNGQIEEAIFGGRIQDNKQLIEEQHIQFQQKIVPFISLTPERWQQWQQDYVHAAKNDAEKANRALEAIDWNNRLRAFFNFRTTTMTIDRVGNDDNDGIAEICAVFEKMNSTGVKLSVFDLLTARLYRHEIYLRELWQDAYQTHDNLSWFSEETPGLYAVLILRTMALLRGQDTKSSNIINLAPKDFEKDFKRATHGIEKALARIRSTHGYGAFDKKWLPYPPMVAPLGALLEMVDEHKLGSNGLKVIDRWYWGSVFNERYSSSAESTATRDYRDVFTYISGRKDKSEVLGEINTSLTEQNIINKLYGTNLTRSSVYRGVMCLLALNNARDFRLEDPITLNTLDDHHIFPKNYLSKKYGKNKGVRLTEVQINCILNKTLISDSTNKTISSKAPLVYLADKNIINAAQRVNILEKHFIDTAGLEALQKDDYTSFLEARARSLAKEITKRVSDETI